MMLAWLVQLFQGYIGKQADLYPPLHHGGSEGEDKNQGWKSKEI